MERIAIFAKKLRELNQKIDSLSGMPGANAAELAALTAEFDNFVTWCEGWVNDFIWVDTHARDLWDAQGAWYLLPWE